MRKHYHVLSGYHGLRPDRDEVFSTKKEAEADMRRLRDEVFDSVRKCFGEACSSQKSAVFEGSIKDGLLIAKFPRLAELEYIELSECDMDIEACL